MRTALILLFLLAVAAVPGSLLPQRPLNAEQDVVLHRLARELGAVPRRHRDVRRLRFGVVRGDLPAAVRVTGRLPDPANPRARARDGAQAAAGPAAPRPAAGVHPLRDLGRRRRVRARRAFGPRTPVARGPSRGAVGRGDAVRGEGIHPRDRQPDLPHRPARRARPHRRRPALQLRGPTRGRRGPDNGFCNTISQYDSWNPGRFAAEGKVRPGAVLHRRADEVHRVRSPPTASRRASAPTSATGPRSTRRSGRRRSASTTRCASRATACTSSVTASPPR